jgi:hypothetical protein
MNDYSSLLGNSQHVNRLAIWPSRGGVFYAIGATTVGMQSFDKHVPKIDCFCVVGAEAI